MKKKKILLLTNPIITVGVPLLTITSIAAITEDSNSEKKETAKGEIDKLNSLNEKEKTMYKDSIQKENNDVNIDNFVKEAKELNAIINDAKEELEFERQFLKSQLPKVIITAEKQKIDNLKSHIESANLENDTIRTVQNIKQWLETSNQMHDSILDSVIDGLRNYINQKETEEFQLKIKNARRQINDENNRNISKIESEKQVFLDYLKKNNPKYSLRIRIHSMKNLNDSQKESLVTWLKNLSYNDFEEKKEFPNSLDEMMAKLKNLNSYEAEFLNEKTEEKLNKNKKDALELKITEGNLINSIDLEVIKTLIKEIQANHRELFEELIENNELLNNEEKEVLKDRLKELWDIESFRSIDASYTQKINKKQTVIDQIKKQENLSNQQKDTYKSKVKNENAEDEFQLNKIKDDAIALDQSVLNFKNLIKSEREFLDSPIVNISDEATKEELKKAIDENLSNDKMTKEEIDQLINQIAKNHGQVLNSIVEQLPNLSEEERKTFKEKLSTADSKYKKDDILREIEKLNTDKKELIDEVNNSQFLTNLQKEQLIQKIKNENINRKETIEKEYQDLNEKMKSLNEILQHEKEFLNSNSPANESSNDLYKLRDLISEKKLDEINSKEDIDLLIQNIKETHKNALVDIINNDPVLSDEQKEDLIRKLQNSQDNVLINDIEKEFLNKKKQKEEQIKELKKDLELNLNEYLKDDSLEKQNKVLEDIEKLKKDGIETQVYKDVLDNINNQKLINKTMDDYLKLSISDEKYSRSKRSLEDLLKDVKNIPQSDDINLNKVIDNTNEKNQKLKEESRALIDVIDSLQKLDKSKFDAAIVVLTKNGKNSEISSFKKILDDNKYFDILEKAQKNNNILPIKVYEELVSIKKASPNTLLTSIFESNLLTISVDESKIAWYSWLLIGLTMSLVAIVSGILVFKFKKRK